MSDKPSSRKPLTATQIMILNQASERPDGNIEPMPDNINAGIKLGCRK